MPITPKLLLFDIDGTLTSSAGLTRAAFEAAAKTIYKIDNATNGITPYGSTDQIIFEKLLKNNQIKYSNLYREFQKFISVYIPNLSSMLQESDKPRLYPGVRELLDALKALPQLKLGLATGNIELSALLKLQRHGIAGYFPVGGFGNDSPLRHEIIKIAVGRAQHHFKIPFSARDVWVIGDTPFDIQAAQLTGAHSIAVATGVYKARDLSRANPTAVFKDLTDIKRFIKLVTTDFAAMKRIVRE